jgi:hypothetical protein
MWSRRSRRNQSSASGSIPKSIGNLRLVEDTSVLGWLPVVTHDGENAQSFFPHGFESCVRVLDAIYSRQLGRDLNWADIREDTTSFGLSEGVKAAYSPFNDSGVRGGYVPELMRTETLETIEAIIASHFPDSSECFYALWSGDTFFESFDASIAHSLSSIRHCYIYQGSLESWRSIWPLILPSLWWSAERSWCLARDVDIPWSYIAGPVDFTDLLAESGLPCERAPLSEDF